MTYEEKKARYDRLVEQGLMSREDADEQLREFKCILDNVTGG